MYWFGNLISRICDELGVELVTESRFRTGLSFGTSLETACELLFGLPMSSESQTSQPPQPAIKTLEGGPENTKAAQKTGNNQKKDRKRLQKKLLEQRRQLPIFSAREKLIKEIRDNDSLVIIGETVWKLLHLRV